MNKKRAIATITACGLVAAMALGGSLAYLTDNESHTNTVQVSGNVRVDLVEPNWDETDSDNNGIPDASQETVPNQEILKNPSVVNTGENPAFVFLRLTVPVKDVTRVRDDGTLVTKDDNIVPKRTGANNEKIYHEPQDLFYFKLNNDAEGIHANHWNSKWKRIGVREFNIENAATDTGANSTSYPDQQIGQAVYVFGYADALQPNGAQTVTLFDKIQVKNIIENEIAANQIQNIKIETFAIQSDNLLLGADASHVGTKFTKTENLEVSELREIYDIFVTQNGEITQGNDGTAGDMEWNTWQDTKHGQTEKEADISNQRNLHNDQQGAYLVTTFKNNSVKASVPQTANHNGTDLKVGDTATMVYQVDLRSGAENRPVFTSSNPEVVEIDAANGEYRAIAKGNATLTVTVDGVSASIQVNVQNDSRDPIPVTTVDENNNSNIPNGTTEPETVQP